MLEDRCTRLECIPRVPDIETRDDELLEEEYRDLDLLVDRVRRDVWGRRIRIRAEQEDYDRNVTDEGIHDNHRQNPFEDS